jgi:Xaa-Pro aminopeptidase
MPFVPLKVFADRAKRVRDHLGERDLQALVVTTPDNFFMVSGFHLDVAPWERPVAAVIPRSGCGEPFLVMNELSTNHLKMAAERGSLFIRDHAIYVEHPRARNRTHTRDKWGQLLEEQLRQRGVTGGKLAVEGSGPAALRAAEPGFEFVDATRFLVELRMVKYPEELEIMRKCAALTDFGMDRYVELARPGEVVTVCDLKVAALIAEEGAKKYPEDRLEVRVFTLSGPASAAPHGTGATCGATFKRGDGAVIIVICRLSGLVVENERTIFIGPPKSDVQRRAFEVATEANLAAAEQMVVGNPVSSADAAAQWAIEQAGFGDNIMHRTGHGMGIAGHEFPDDMPFLHRAFMEREVYSCEPGIYLYGVGGFRHDDTVIIGAKKPEVITKRSKRLEDQIVPV